MSLWQITQLVQLDNQLPISYPFFCIHKFQYLPLIKCTESMVFFSLCCSSHKCSTNKMELCYLDGIVSSRAQSGIGLRRGVGNHWHLTSVKTNKVLKRPHTDYNNSSGITILPSCSSCTALLMSCSVILSTARLEVEIVENQSAMWLITVNTRAGHCRLLVWTVWFEWIYLGRWESRYSDRSNPAASNSCWNQA